MCAMCVCSYINAKTADTPTLSEAKDVIVSSLLLLFRHFCLYARYRTRSAHTTRQTRFYCR